MDTAISFMTLRIIVRGFLKYTIVYSLLCRAHYLFIAKICLDVLFVCHQPAMGDRDQIGKQVGRAVSRV